MKLSTPLLDLAYRDVYYKVVDDEQLEKVEEAIQNGMGKPDWYEA